MVLISSKLETARWSQIGRSTWGLDLGRNAGISTQMDSNELNQTSQMTQRRGTSQGGITIGPNPPGNSGVQTQMRSTQAGGKKRKTTRWFKNFRLQ